MTTPEYTSPEVGRQPPQPEDHRGALAEAWMRYFGATSVQDLDLGTLMSIADFVADRIEPPESSSSAMGSN